MAVALKFIFIQPVSADPQYVTVRVDEVAAVERAFAQDEVLTVVDHKTGHTTHCNMANIAFISIRDYVDKS